MGEALTSLYSELFCEEREEREIKENGYSLSGNNSEGKYLPPFSLGTMLK